MDRSAKINEKGSGITSAQETEIVTIIRNGM